jgi:hypothetical protein
MTSRSARACTKGQRQWRAVRPNCSCPHRSRTPSCLGPRKIKQIHDYIDWTNSSRAAVRLKETPRDVSKASLQVNGYFVCVCVVFFLDTCLLCWSSWLNLEINLAKSCRLCDDHCTNIKFCVGNIVWQKQTGIMRTHSLINRHSAAAAMIQTMIWCLPWVLWQKTK